MNIKNIALYSCIILLVFDILYWHVNFHDLNPIGGFEYHKEEKCVIA